jgi:hypothetical protein
MKDNRLKPESTKQTQFEQDNIKAEAKVEKKPRFIKSKVIIHSPF